LVHRERDIPITEKFLANYWYDERWLYQQIRGFSANVGKSKMMSTNRLRESYYLLVLTCLTTPIYLEK
jgi:hypothetical protein